MLEDESGPYEKEDLYTLLNIPKTADEEEVKNAYRRMCVLFHPDKHLEEDKRRKAQLIFNRIHKAYTILGDKKTRSIYDEHGWDGVEAAWQLGPYISGDLEKLKKELEKQRQRKVAGIWQGKTVLSCGLDASMITEDWGPIKQELSWDDYLPFFNIVSISQHLDANLTNDITANISYTTATKGGNGNGIVTTSLTKQISNLLTGRLDFTVGGQKRLGLSFTRIISEKMSMQIGGGFNFYGGSVDPSLQVSLTRAITENIVASGTYLGGDTTGIVLTLNHVSKTTPGSLSLRHISDHGIGIDAKIAHEIDHQNIIKARLSTTSAVQLSFGLVRRFLDNSDRKLSILMEMGSAFGVGLKFTLSLHDLHLVFPIYIARELATTSIMYGFAIPSIVGLFVHNLIMEPYQRYIRNAKVKSLQESNQCSLDELMNDAVMAIDLMTPFYARRREHEVSIKGLVIIKATCEKASVMGSPIENIPPESFLDVTIPLQLLVNDSLLWIPSGSKVNNLGFYDVAFGSKKILRIVYLFRDAKHVAIFRDEDEVMAPLRHHLIPE